MTDGGKWSQPIGVLVEEDRARQHRRGVKDSQPVKVPKGLGRLVPGPVPLADPAPGSRIKLELRV
jgi:hypothetical protein